MQRLGKAAHSILPTSSSAPAPNYQQTPPSVVFQHEAERKASSPQRTPQPRTTPPRAINQSEKEKHQMTPAVRDVKTRNDAMTTGQRGRPEPVDDHRTPAGRAERGGPPQGRTTGSSPDARPAAPSSTSQAPPRRAGPGTSSSTTTSRSPDPRASQAGAPTGSVAAPGGRPQPRQPIHATSSGSGRPFGATSPSQPQGERNSSTPLFQRSLLHHHDREEIATHPRAWRSSTFFRRSNEVCCNEPVGRDDLY